MSFVGGSPISPEALTAARQTMLAAMAASDGPGYRAAIEVAAAIPVGRVLEVLATLAVLGARRGEILLDSAMAADIFSGEATP